MRRGTVPVTFSDIFPNLDIFAVSFSIINFAGRISKVVIGRAGARSASFRVLLSLKIRERAVRGRARAAKNPLVRNIVIERR
jgi:hypothetical protein